MKNLTILSLFVLVLGIFSTNSFANNEPDPDKVKPKMIKCHDGEETGNTTNEANIFNIDYI